MTRSSRCAPLLLALLATLAAGQTPPVLGDLEARVTLSKEELGQLLPGARMSRLNTSGNTNAWKNDPGGSFIVSSDNRVTSGAISRGPSTAPGKWHISDDGRYCVLIEWKSVPPEEWCRFIVKAGGVYYGTRSDKIASERVYKLEISK